MIQRGTKKNWKMGLRIYGVCLQRCINPILVLKRPNNRMEFLCFQMASLEPNSSRLKKVKFLRSLMSRKCGINPKEEGSNMFDGLKLRSKCIRIIVLRVRVLRWIRFENSLVVHLSQTVDIILDHHQHSVSPEFENQIKSIHQHASFLRSFIESSSKNRVNSWEEEIRQVSYKAEDIIELLLSDSLLGASRSAELEKGKDEICYSFDELEKVTEEIESIVNGVMRRRRFERGDDSDEELMEIVSLLVGGSSSLEIIAICGSSGIGKSYLAFKACYHPLIKEHFGVLTGSIVTREYIFARLIGDLIRKMKADFRRPDAKDDDSKDELIEMLLQMLGGRRYLIWLDDVWSKDVMERLKMVLPDYGNGSRIIFTTQSSEVAESAQHVHEMRLLDDNESWYRLRQNIFQGDPCPFQLVSTGKTIARCCAGHQLSIAVVSGILAADQSEAAWDDVLANIKVVSNNVDEIVYLSYLYLPHHLRPCCLYFGIYPQGISIYVPVLVRLWVAEGFVNESEYKSFEEIGEGYLDDLVNRHLASVNEWKCNGRIKSIRVHDLVQGMCQRQARIDNFSHRFSSSILSSKEIIKPSRRVSIFNDCDDFLSGVYSSTVRTLYFFLIDSTKLDLRWIDNVRLLRILHLLGVINYQLSDELFELFHLRYFALYLPPNKLEAIPNLQNLQTLVICHEKEGGVFDKLPEGIWRMPQLRHLCIISFKFPNGKEPSSPLQNLQTLCKTVDFACSREVLEMFPNVKKLDLLYTKNWKGVVGDYELHNLIYLHKLEVLKLKTNLSVGEDHKMSCATFPQTLKKLSLQSLQLSWEDMQTVASLPNLEVLKLRNHACIGKTWETSDGGFPQLLYLRIEESNLEKWITKSSHFPELRMLVLVRCSSLLEVPYEMAEIPKLQQIHLDGTNSSLWRSAKQIQQDRHSLGHDPLHVDVV